jgi:hypothetical protein
MKRSPLKRKTPLAPKGAAKKPKRDPWIKPKEKVDLSRMDCCSEAEARATMLVMLPCAACGERGTAARRGEFRRPRDMVIHHLRKGTGAGARAVWWKTINLHEEHHADAWRFSIHGADSDKFREAYGSEEEMLERANSKICCNKKLCKI